MTDDERRAAMEVFEKAFKEFGEICTRQATAVIEALERENDRLAKLLAQTVDFTYGELYLTIKAALAERNKP